MSDNALVPAGTSEIVAQPARDAVPDGSTADHGVTAFTFGDAEPVLDRHILFESIAAWTNGRWYEPPISMNGLVRAFDVPGPHASCIRLKVNLLTKHFIPSQWLSRTDFRKMAVDFLATGNGYFERRDNLAGRPMRLRHSLARYTRVGAEEGQFYFVPDYKIEHKFEPGSVFHLLQEHPSQEIYGLPEFLGALQAALLGEAATLFRRRYYLNGSHAGYIFYANSDKFSNESVESIRQSMRDAKGGGNFKNLFIHAPGGGKDGIQIIPLSEAAAKDEFLNVKRVSRDEMLCAHRTPPQLVGIVPENNAGFGDTEKALAVYFSNEIAPIMERMGELNDWIGVTAVAFSPYMGVAAAAVAA